MIFLVTGGCGFIGSNMVDFLIDNGNSVIVIDNLSTGKKENLNPDSEFYNFDISDVKNINLLESLIERCQFIIHMAATPNVQQSIDNPISSHINNFNSTLNILECMRKIGGKKMIFSSTSAMYGNPIQFPTDENCKLNPMSPYALQKLISEQYIKLYHDLYNIESIILRYFNVFGERMTNEGAYKSVISIFQECESNQLPLTITNDGEQRRDFIYVKDVVMANYLSCLSDIKFDIFNVGSGKNISINEISNYFKGDKKYIGKRIEPFKTLSNCSKIKTKLGWKTKISVDDWLSKKNTI